jgi:uncharacterized protein YqhQ
LEEKKKKVEDKNAKKTAISNGFVSIIQVSMMNLISCHFSSKSKKKDVEAESNKESDSKINNNKKNEKQKKEKVITSELISLFGTIE